MLECIIPLVPFASKIQDQFLCCLAIEIMNIITNNRKFRGVIGGFNFDEYLQRTFRVCSLIYGTIYFISRIYKMFIAIKSITEELLDIFFIVFLSFVWLDTFF